MTMKLFTFVMCAWYLLPVQAEHKNRYAYCESCLTAAKEIEKAMKNAPVKSRQTVVEKLLSRGVCKKLQSYKHNHVSKDQMTASCVHLFDSHREKFRAALVNKDPRNIEIILCYEQSTACVGVKHQSLKESKSSFKDSDIDALLRDNKENVRFAQPIRSGSKDEL